MRSNIVRCLAVCGLTVALMASCKSKPKNIDENANANAGAAVVDRDSNLDPAGSDGGKIAGLSTVYFEYDQARLTSETRKTLAANAEWMKAHANYTIQIEGHTDDRGSVEYNLSLGERRAKSVKSYLESLGVPAAKLNLISYGEEKPLQSGDSEAAWSKNRRANFVPLQ